MNALRNGAFARLLAAHVVAQIGTGVTMLALPLIAAIDLGATPFQVGLLSAAEAIPLLALGLLAGVWVDRRRRRPIMVASDVARAAALLVIPLAAWQGWLRFEALVAVVLVVGALGVLFDIASQSYVATLLRGDDLIGANSLLYTSYSVGEVAGPGVAGLLLHLMRAPFAVIANAASFLASALLLASGRDSEPEPHPAPTRRSLRADLAEGLRIVAHTPTLRTLGISTGGWNIFDNARSAMLVLFLARDLGVGAGAIGVVYAAGSVGYVLGSALPLPAARRLGLGRAITGGIVATLPGSLLIALADGPPEVAGALVAAGFFLEGLVVPIYDVNQFSLRQAITPDHLQGRVGAVLRVIIRGTIPLGALLGGALATWFGLRGVMWFGVLGAPAALAVVWFSPVPRLRSAADAHGPG